MLSNKLAPSRHLVSAIAIMSLLPMGDACAITLSRAESMRIGKKIWQNECNGTIAGLTSWNSGENFASLGIGHFIWYPQGQRGPFDESFPKLISFAASRGAKLPAMLSGGGEMPCPWNSQAEFESARQSPEMQGLRRFLADTVDVQADFLVQRLQNALAKMLSEAPAADRDKIRQRFERVSKTAQGCYALVDYVNFKGEGVLATERYKGEGWGLLQVLEQMRDGGNAVNEFAQAAKAVLTRRVKNSPAERRESRWLAGWLKRIDTYTTA